MDELELAYAKDQCILLAHYIKLVLDNDVSIIIPIKFNRRQWEILVAALEIAGGA